jgi:hypothetical protein
MFSILNSGLTRVADPQHMPPQRQVYPGVQSLSRLPYQGLQQADRLHVSPLMFGGASPKTAVINGDPHPQRTRMTVFKDMMKRYFTKGVFFAQLALSTVVGAVAAIGTPAMIVTVPSTFISLMVITAYSWARTLSKDPNGAEMNRLYAQWAQQDKMGYFRWHIAEAKRRQAVERRIGTADG